MKVVSKLIDAMILRNCSVIKVKNGNDLRADEMSEKRNCSTP
jgi:hypothetical protein